MKTGRWTAVSQSAFGGFRIANFADHDDVWILTHEGAGCDGADAIAATSFPLYTLGWGSNFAARPAVENAEVDRAHARYLVRQVRACRPASGAPRCTTRRAFQECKRPRRANYCEAIFVDALTPQLVPTDSR
jgi:hypothetical protein